MRNGANPLIIGSSAAKLQLPFGSNSSCGDDAIANGDVVGAGDAIDTDDELAAGIGSFGSTCVLLSLAIL